MAYALVLLAASFSTDHLVFDRINNAICRLQAASTSRELKDIDLELRRYNVWAQLERLLKGSEKLTRCCSVLGAICWRFYESIWREGYHHRNSKRRTQTLEALLIEAPIPQIFARHHAFHHWSSRIGSLS